MSAIAVLSAAMPRVAGKPRSHSMNNGYSGFFRSHMRPRVGSGGNYRDMAAAKSAAATPVREYGSLDRSLSRIQQEQKYHSILKDRNNGGNGHRHNRVHFSEPVVTEYYFPVGPTANDRLAGGERKNLADVVTRGRFLKRQNAVDASAADSGRSDTSLSLTVENKENEYLRENNNDLAVEDLNSSLVPVKQEVAGARMLASGSRTLQDEPTVSRAAAAAAVSRDRDRFDSSSSHPSAAGAREARADSELQQLLQQQQPTSFNGRVRIGPVVANNDNNNSSGQPAPHHHHHHHHHHGNPHHHHHHHHHPRVGSSGRLPPLADPAAAAAAAAKQREKERDELEQLDAVSAKLYDALNLHRSTTSSGSRATAAQGHPSRAATAGPTPGPPPPPPQASVSGRVGGGSQMGLQTPVAAAAEGSGSGGAGGEKVIIHRIFLEGQDEQEQQQRANTPHVKNGLTATPVTTAVLAQGEQGKRRQVEAVRQMKDRIREFARML